MNWLKKGSIFLCKIGESRKQCKCKFHFKETKLLFFFFFLTAVWLIGSCQFSLQAPHEIVKDGPGTSRLVALAFSAAWWFFSCCLMGYLYFESPIEISWRFKILCKLTDKIYETLLQIKPSPLFYFKVN